MEATSFIMKFSFCVCFSVFLLSCKILFGQTNNMLVTIPPGAGVFTFDNKKLGITPFDLSNTPQDQYKLKIYAEGFDTTTVSFYEKSKKGFTVPESFADCTPPCRVKTGSDIYQENLSLTFLLNKEIKEEEHFIMVAIDTPKLMLTPKAAIGKLNGRQKNLDDDEIHRTIGYTDNIDLQIISGFENSYLAAYYTGKIAKDEDKTTLYKPKIILKPEITAVDFNLGGKLLRDQTGLCRMSCTWKMSTINAPQKIIASIPLTTTFYRTVANYELVLHQLLFESQRELLQIDTLYSFLQKTEADYLSGKQGKPIKLVNTVKNTFASTKEMLKAITQPVFTIENRKGFGSGFMVGSSGYIITNYHVVQEDTTPMIRITADKKIKATIVKVNPDYDLALLKIENNTTQPLAVGNSNDLMQGEEVYAVGTPLDKSFGQSVTKGIISGFREFNGVKFIQTDVSINSGNSGGPLVNDKGEVIGITTLKLAGKGIEGLGFCIPISLAVEKLEINFNK